ncbi:hypothetical protein C8F01DRAFT_1113677 [Mycena amicta]|nr:hypothetical protein C8F01DRAFT_1113677 [Mycena amicta]
MATTTDSDSPVETARALMKRKDEIDVHLQLYASQLAAEGATMVSPLVDTEGFPRPDIDLYRVRAARRSIIELRNDRQVVIEALAVVLSQVYDPSQLTADDGDSGIVPSGKPFAKVDGVSPGSPAAEAGLLRGDLIVRFDTLTQQSFTSSSLSPLVAVVNEHENRSIPLKIIREGQNVTMILVPKRWPGRGLLGCHIVPYSPP